MPDEARIAARALAEHIFTPPERWGWEYREPVPARPSPELEAEPLWFEPPLPLVSIPGVVASRSTLVKRAVVIGACALLGLATARYGGGPLVIVALILVLVWFVPYFTTPDRGPVPYADAEFLAARNADYVRYQEAWASWKASVDSWMTGEKVRVDSADLWYPVGIAAGASRVDVFGGTPDGWAAMVATLGASNLSSERSVLIVDLTEHDVSRELIAMARGRGVETASVDLPTDLARVDLLRGLSAEIVAELIAEAVFSSRPSDASDLRTIDAELVRAVTNRLDGDLTFRRIAAGLQVLRRSYDPPAVTDPVLSDSEIQRLSAYVDAAGQDEQAQRELHVLASMVGLLVQTSTPTTERAVSLWTTGALVLRTGDDNRRRKDFADRLLVQTLIHHLRTRRGTGGTAMLMLLGGDDLGLSSLETMVRLARRAGVRTVVFVEHLRGDMVHLLGGADSASVIMRLGNAQEAASAADFIGRGYKFVLNQLTRQISDAVTEGESKSWGAGGTVSNSHSTMSGAGSGVSNTSGVSRTDNWSRTVNWSTTNTVSDGSSVSRVYELAVEPTQIQSLPTTAFVLVDAYDGPRRIVAADCNPGIALLERIAGDTRRVQAPPSVRIGSHAEAPPPVEPPPIGFRS